MTAPLDRTEIRELARLARIAVEDDALDGIATDLRRVLGLVESMRAADVEGVEPMAHPVATALRPRADEPVALGDEAARLAAREALQRSAPEVHDGYYTVPRVVE